MPKIVVYLPVRAKKELEAEGHDAAEWVRNAVKAALRARGQTVRPDAVPAGGKRRG